MPATRIAQTLISQNKLTQEQWAEIEQEAKKEGTEPEEILIKKSLISEKDLGQMKAELFNLPFVDLGEVDIPSDVLNTIPQAVAENYHLIVYEKQDNDVKIALVHPGDYRSIEAIDFWAKKGEYKTHFAVTTHAGYRDALKGYTAFQKEVSDALEVLQKQRVTTEKKAKKRLVEVIKKAPVSTIVDLMIQEAVDLGTSDIHIEPSHDASRVRFRVDGVLRVYLNFPEHFHSSIVSRIKVLANLKIDETRIPQDGRIRTNVYDQEVNLRVSTLPVMGNEKVVMRILQSEVKTPTLKDLGFWYKVEEDLDKIIARPTGVLLVAGPTGSGKSTTLFSILSALNKETANISTLEDPVEYFMKGVNQTQVNPEVGLTFASGLRALLRQDPNIVMVGEIRDTETAELAIHAALTGHFLVSTIHAKDVLGVIPRLIDMHIEPFLISAAMNAVLAQRLVRKICPECKHETTVPSPLEKEFLQELETIPEASRSMLEGISTQGPLKFYKGGDKQCDVCGGSGYKGRTVVAEALLMTPELTEIMNTKFSLEDLVKELRRQGKTTFKQDAIIKALHGVTTIEEVLRVTRE